MTRPPSPSPFFIFNSNRGGQFGQLNAADCINQSAVWSIVFRVSAPAEFRFCLENETNPANL